MATSREGLQSYYQQKIEEYEQRLREKELDVKRLEVQRNEWNNKGAFLTFLFLNQHHHVGFGAGKFISELNGSGNVPVFVAQGSKCSAHVKPNLLTDVHTFYWVC
jgi:uncharacterized damage-inducible protein DinB